MPVRLMTVAIFRFSPLRIVAARVYYGSRHGDAVQEQDDHDEHHL